MFGCIYPDMYIASLITYDFTFSHSMFIFLRWHMGFFNFFYFLRNG